ncbi:MAG: hypothetical protein QOI82_1895 [Actinomycetota bacterium]|nr:hypothetical protein [Actinomycetota bacterium]
MRRVTAVVGALFAVLAISLPAYAESSIELPRPGAALAQELQLVCNPLVGGLPERCKKSAVPGPVVNDEVVLVGVAGSGAASRVQLEQRLLLTKVGDYVIRERGPARSAVPLVKDSDPPNTKFGAVVYQGFTPGNRKLGARLSLDTGLEEPRLPLGVSVTFDDADGARELGPGGQIPGAGAIHIRVENRTAQPADLPTGADANPAALAGPLDAALRFAQAPPGPRLPSTDTVLPRQVTVVSPAVRSGTQSVPLRITGSLRLTGTTGTVTGPGLTPLPDGGVVAGTLSADPSTVEFTAEVQSAGQLVMDLAVVPTLDKRVLTPPRHLPTWGAWARSRPPITERRAALDLLVATAATGARASSYSPYLGVDLPGTGSTVFRYSFAAADRAAAADRQLQPRPGPIALTGVALLLLVVNGTLLWRRS